MIFYDVIATNILLLTVLSAVSSKTIRIIFLSVLGAIVFNLPIFGGFSLVVWACSILAAPSVLTVVLILLWRIVSLLKDYPLSKGMPVLLFLWCSISILGMAALLGPYDIYHATPLVRFAAVATMLFIGMLLERRYILVAIGVLLAYNLSLMNSINIIDYTADVYLWLGSGAMLLKRSCGGAISWFKGRRYHAA